jgi:hypothetical protein
MCSASGGRCTELAGLTAAKRSPATITGLIFTHDGLLGIGQAHVFEGDGMRRMFDQILRKARVTVLSQLEIERVDLHASDFAITGLSFEPRTVWLDGEQRFFRNPRYFCP